MKSGVLAAGRLAAVAATLVLASCGGSGDSAPAPTGLSAVVGDGVITVSWNDDGNTSYWLLMAADARVAASNWSGLLEGRAIVNARSPQVVCALNNDRTYYFTINGRTGSAGGGPDAPVISATPRAAGATWTAGTALAATVNGLGYAFLTSCTSDIRPSGLFTAVGPAAALSTSSDGRSWTARTAPTGFTADLFGVAAVTARINNTADPGLRFVAVGAGGSSIYSVDGVTWTVGRAPDSGRPAFRAITVVGTQFFAVGDGGTIAQSLDGITWDPRTSNTTANLNAVTYASGRFVAVGAGGVVVTSLDGITWTATTQAGAGNLTAVGYGNRNSNINGGGTALINTTVAVSDSGIALVSTDQGLTWTQRVISAGTPLSGVSYTTRFVITAANGASYTSFTGTSWSAAVPTGIGSARAIGTDGYGFVIAGGGGANASSF